MSLRAKIEAVIYAAEEPVTLAQLAGIFSQELPPAPPEGQPSVESLIEQGFIEADPSLALSMDHMVEVARLTALEEREQPQPDAATAEAEAKRAARQREREVRDQLKEIIEGLIEEYAGSDRGMEIREVAGGYRIATKPEYHDAVRAFVKSLKPPMKLSLQALETLAVIAYKQPITAPEVSEVRGVDSGGVLGGLMSRKLITTAGRKQVIGRPILYKTTREFLLRFGLKDLKELPSIEEFEKLAGDIEIGEDGTSETPVEAVHLPIDESTAEPDPGDALTKEADDPSLATVPPSERVGLAESEVGPASRLNVPTEMNHG